MATPPRPVYPGQTVFITWRAVNRCFRFVPTNKNTDTLWYAFAYACKQHKVQVHSVTILSNHGHLVATFPEGDVPDFMNLFGSLAGRSLNAIIGIKGSVIEKGYSSLAPADGERILEHCAYTLANPCAADLVTRARHWKGVTSAGMHFGERMIIKKPKCGIWTPREQKRKRKRKSNSMRRRKDTRAPKFCNRSTLPESVEFGIVRPTIFPDLSDDEIQEEIQRRLTEKEEVAEAKRATAGKKVMGMKHVKAQFWGAMPGKEELFGGNPTTSSSSRWGRMEALQRRQAFIEAYHSARSRWLAGEVDVVFPHGTWLLRRLYGVRCSEGPAPMPA